MAQPDPAVAAVRSAVAAGVAGLPPGSLVLVACSGGPDSLALAAALAFVAERGGRTSRVGSRPGPERGGSAASPAGLRAGAVVVDHGLQPGSAAVAERAAGACRRLGLEPVVVRAVRVGAAGGPEAAARDARYAALEDVARECGAAAVLLGHTLDDQAETVLLGLARGSGARSLAGMPAVRVPFRRPLLGLRRATTVAACGALGLEPWHDPTNEADGGPLRSRVRGVVLPVLERELGPGVAEALARSAAQLRADADALDALAVALLAEARVVAASVVDPPGHDDGRPGGADDEGIDAEALAAAPGAVRVRALRLAALATGVPPGALRAEHVDALDALVTRWRGQGPVALPGGLVGRRACGRLFLGAPPARDELPAAADHAQHD
ncbi:tRNA lysidine(34) synthetase TilS [Cellulomonas alba]|uniref:tRNA(Ile)-lysidine synthase n=1 Tax=Cellulomonas alba TaxID=3053467 RepID=A0ABT7SGN0_9CELL|nr:tRNA lysidine(34) synthetase TilS [Cellulomonas alba]MDM7855353.1 tRNA lysidine(34) synthetase TilS [Cellulomonas alba]